MSKQHELSSKHIEHEDWVMNVMEKMALHSFKERLDMVEKNYNITLRFKVSYDDETSFKGKSSTELNKSFLFAYFSFLPIMITTDVQEMYMNLFPDSEFPFMLVPSSEALFNYYPAVRNMNNMSAMFNIFDASIEQMIHNQLVYSLMPLSASTKLNYDVLKDKVLEKNLFQIIADNNITEVMIDLESYINQFQNIVNNLKMDEPDNQLSQFDYLQPDISSLSKALYDAGHQKPTKIRIGTPDDLVTFMKPQYSPTERMEDFKREENLERQQSINKAQNIHSKII